ncbi:hypothetical protein BDR04DRAFT_1123800, partial [Suillus decipiens]
MSYLQDNISAQNNSKDEVVELPKALKKIYSISKAIRGYYCQFLTNEDDIQAEEEFLRDEPDNLFPEEREAAAHPKDAAFYKKEISDWDVVQKLFKQEMDQYDKDEQEKLGVKNEIKRLRMHGKSGIWKALLQNHKQCIERGTSKKYLNDFTEQMCRTMGCQVVILASHKKTTDQTLSVIVIMMENDCYLVMSQSPSTVKNCLHRVVKEISSGPQKVLKNLQNGQSWNFEPSEENDNKSDEEDEDKGKGSLPELILDNQGYMKLPSCTGVSSKGQQELWVVVCLRSFMQLTISFTEVFTNTAKPVPWHEVVGKPTLYLDPEFLPKGFTLRDPSHMRTENVNELWAHWEARKAARKPL